MLYVAGSEGEYEGVLAAALALAQNARYKIQLVITTPTQAEKTIVRRMMAQYPES